MLWLLCFLFSFNLWSTTNGSNTFSPNTIEDRTVHLGLLLDCEDDIMNGIDNDTVESLIQVVKEPMSKNLTIQTDVIPNYDDFESEIEDNSEVCNRFTAIITALSCKRTKSLYSQLLEHCPTTLVMAIIDRNCIRPPKEQGIGFPVMTSVSDVISMLVDMKHDFLRTWDHINVVHDDSIDKEMLHDLVEALTSLTGPGIRETTVTTFKVDSKEPFFEQSVAYDPYGNRTSSPILRKAIGNKYTSEELIDHFSEDPNMQYFILLANRKVIQDVIEQAHNRSLLHFPRRWLVIFSTVVKNKKFWKKMSHIFATTDTAIVQREVSEYDQCNEMKEGCQLRLAFETFREAADKVAAETPYDFTDIDMKGVTKNRLLAEIRLLLGNDQTMAQYCGNCDRYVLQIYEKKQKSKKIRKSPRFVPWVENKVDNSYEVKITNKAEWTPFKGMLQESEPVRAKSEYFSGREVIVGIVPQPPLIKVERQNGVCNVTGTTPSLMELLASRLNFTIRWWCSDDVKELGVYDSNTQKWTGLLGKLVAKEIDIAANNFWRTQQMIKSNQFAFLSAHAVDAVGFMVDKTPEDHQFLFLTPFHWDTWVCVLGCCILIGPIFYFIHRSTKYYDYYDLKQEKDFFSFGNCVWYCFGAILQQGGDHLPPAVSGRMIVAFWWLYVIVTVTTYSGNMVALLTFPKIVQPIQNTEDLMDAFFMSWGAPQKDPIQVYTEEALYGPITELRKEMKWFDFGASRDHIFDRVAAGRLGYVAREFEARRWISDEYYRTKECRMHYAKYPIFQVPVSIVVRKEVPADVIAAMDFEIYVMKRAGLTVYWQKHYEEPGNDCMYPKIIHAGDVKKVAIKHMIGSFYILAWGLASSLICLICEIVYFGCIKSKANFTTGVSAWERFKVTFTRLYSASLYPAWLGSAMDPLKASQKTAKLSFVHPKVQSQEFAKAGWSIGNRPKPFGAVYGGQYGSVYGNAGSTIYNAKENFNYFNYDSTKNTFKPRFGQQ